MLYFVLPICYQFWYARKYTFVQHLPGKQLFAPLAQLAEQVTLNHWVAGSIPARCTIFAQSTYRCAIGILRPTPKARLVTFNPGADCSRLYSLRSTRRCTHRTVFSSNPRPIMSRALRFSST